LHVGEGRGGVVSGRIVAGARQVDLGVVGLFLDEQVEMFPGFREATAEDQEVGHVQVGGVLIGLDFDGFDSSW